MKALIALGYIIMVSAIAFVIYGAYTIHPGFGIMMIGVAVLLIASGVITALTD